MTVKKELRVNVEIRPSEPSEAAAPAATEKPTENSPMTYSRMASGNGPRVFEAPMSDPGRVTETQKEDPMEFRPFADVAADLRSLVKSEAGHIAYVNDEIDLMLKLHDALAQRCEVLESRWQPIETAPKDGSRVLLWHSSWYGSNTGFYGGIGWRQASELAPFAKQPTHWIPLPLAPPLSALKGSSPDA